MQRGYLVWRQWKFEVTLFYDDVDSDFYPVRVKLNLPVEETHDIFTDRTKTISGYNVKLREVDFAPVFRETLKRSLRDHGFRDDNNYYMFTWDSCRKTEIWLIYSEEENKFFLGILT